jgi:hypothetical protein
LKRILLLSFFLLAVLPLHGKDIDLDRIYIKEDSRFYRQLLHRKIDAHKAIHSLFVDRDVTFAHWISGKEIIYIKELTGSNVIIRYSLIHHKREEVFRFKGTVTFCQVSNNKRYLFIKRFLSRKEDFPRGETILLNIKQRKVITLNTAHLFVDFTQSPKGYSIIYETGRGFIEHYPVTGIKRLVCRRIKYADIIRKNGVNMLYYSPNRLKKLIISGSGGYYMAKVITRRRTWKIRNLTSATEIAWINNRYFFYRSGAPGYYSLNLYDTVKRRSRRIISHSLNTNLNYSFNAGIAAALKNQVVHIYRISEKRLINLGFEGEDISFSPDGNRFTSLLFKKLFITNVYSIDKHSLLLKKNSEMILEIYRELLRKKGDWANEYTARYLKKKIAEYKVLAGE